MDTAERPYSKAVLLSEIEAAWMKLNEALDKLTPEQMTEIRDTQGWAVKDHLVHMAAWERSVVVFLQGRPRHEGLGIDRQLYDTGDEDAMNAAIQEQRKDIPLSEALAEFRDVHSQLLSLLQPMSEDGLYRANSDLEPEASGERDERPVIGMIYGNSANHFREHQEWIASLISQGR